uniref:MscS Mechanosensitive ion channel n=2 Tax=Gloeothece TaxID=28070 RepID=E0UJ11_GLOV7|nr:MscS Mechanosensitive ion channel [Gloeothece verrucosa PCC 7822]
MVLSCVFSTGSVSAQPQQTAPIIVDGNPIFEVSPSGQFTASQRADEANRILREIIKDSKSPVRVEIDSNRDLPVILVNNSHILSVTSNDLPKGRSITEQAKIWQQQLAQAIEQAQYERTLSYLMTATLISLAVLLVAFFITYQLEKLWHRWIDPLLERANSQVLLTETGQPLTQLPTQPRPKIQVFSEVFLNLIKGLIGFISIIYVTRLFPQTRQLSYDFVNLIVNSLVADLVTLGDKQYSVLDLVFLIAVLIALVFFARTLGVVLRSRVLSFTGLSRAAQETIALMANYTMVFIGAIIILQLWGLDISSLTVFAGVLGVGIGLGIQGIAKEFVSGLVLIFERPIQVGDFVEVGELMGTVERISVRSTEIKTLDQISVILPNSRFLESEVINWNHRTPVSRLKLAVGVAYGSDLSLVKNALLDAAKQHKEVLTNPPPKVGFVGFGDSCLDFQLLIWISKPNKQFQIKSDLYFIIDSIFRKRGINIPFPQQDLNIESGKLQVEISPELINSLTELSQSLAAWIKHQTNSQE